MRSLLGYIDPKLAAKFTAALPRLKKKLGAVPYAKRKPSYGVAGETFRAYQGWNNKPSELYRDWAAVICESLTSELLVTHLQSRSAFLKWHESLAASLQKQWFSRERKRLSFAHQYKLVDLFVKWLSRHDFGLKTITSGFAAYANCALDRQTLKKLNACLSHALPMPAPSMGHIICRNTYQFSQEAISEFAAYCGGTPLLFDYFAWKKGG
jgi:hypothetical protein